MLVGAVTRLTSGRGDPVIQLQTNFGGGKTHSMLAMYHLFSGTPPTSLAGVDELMAEAAVNGLPEVQRVVLVGNKISPARPDRKLDGTVVRTLWGELAWQLGGKDAYARIAADDEKGTSPGDALRGMFNDFGPCVVLIDEWVAYARQLHHRSDLPAGSFETQFTFAQTLTESAKAAANCLLVISLPASDTAGSPHTQADDVESRRRSRPGSSGTTQQRGRPAGIRVASGDRRRGLRHRPKAAFLRPWTMRRTSSATWSRGHSWISTSGNSTNSQQSAATRSTSAA